MRQKGRSGVTGRPVLELSVNFISSEVANSSQPIFPDPKGDAQKDPLLVRACYQLQFSEVHCGSTALPEDRRSLCETFGSRQV